MAKVKIICNPYEKKTEFEYWCPKNETWESVAPDKALREKSITNGFFPFKAEDIVKTIIGMYEKAEIEFEGTSDDYDTLKYICEDYSDSITLCEHLVKLENARDILGKIAEIFKQDIEPVVNGIINEIKFDDPAEKDKIKGDLRKCEDASDVKIPICVMGTVSAGKSTFINALLGYDYLPSGDDPTTAKIHMVSSTPYTDRAEIEFEYNGEKINLEIKDGKNPIQPIYSGDLIEQIKDVLERAEDTVSVPQKLKWVLEVIQKYSSQSEISDYIKINAPIAEKGILGSLREQFVIFDTPGSNSASNDTHLKVLEKAMEDYSNGMPVFVSKIETLDTNDNASLSDKILAMEQIDNRFTVIIVNQADNISKFIKGQAKNISFDNSDNVLNLAIPKKMYAAGLYYVSSIMGLGYKNGGTFLDGDNKFGNETTCQSKMALFTDKHEKGAYIHAQEHNIIPKCKRDEVDEYSKELLYLNSGLYSIEQAIERFVKYDSPYNKCQQSKVFLEKVIDKTKEGIKDKIKECKEEKNALKKSYSDSEKALKTNIETKHEDIEKEIINNYDKAKQATCAAIDKECKISKADVEKWMEEFHKEKAVEFDIEGLKKKVEDAKKSRSNDRKKSRKDLKEADEKVKKSRKDLKDAEKKVKIESQNAVIDKVNEELKNRLEKANDELSECSRKYWEEGAEKYREELINVVTNSEGIEEKTRNELANVITEYANPKFERGKVKNFDIDDFRTNFFGIITKLDIGKLVRDFNDRFEKEWKGIHKNVVNAHPGKFSKWAEALKSKLIGKMEELNPTLRNIRKSIKDKENQIKILNEKEKELACWLNKISAFMAWKGNEY